MDKFVEAIEVLAREAGYKVTNDGAVITIVTSDNTLEIVEEIINHFNDKAKSKYKPGAKDSISKVKALIKAGYTVDQIKSTITHMVYKWTGDPKMEQYIRPSTILRLNKFENYYAETLKGNNNSLLALFKDDWQ